MNFSEKPLIIGIGAQKAATTWLADYFGKHPQIYMSAIKELHYFDSVYAPELSAHFHVRFFRDLERLLSVVRKPEQIKRLPQTLLECLLDRIAMIYDEGMYIGYFSRRVTHETAFCEITPGYAVLTTEIYRKMAAIHKDVRFIFILRDPVDRFWSALSDVTVPHDYDYVLNEPSFRLRADYERTIMELEAAVPPDRILYLFYEDLFTERALRRLCRFIDIGYIVGDFERRVHQRARSAPPDCFVKDAYAGLRAVYAFAADRFGAALPERWRYRMSQHGQRRASLGGTAA